MQRADVTAISLILNRSYGLSNVDCTGADQVPLCQHLK